MAFEVFKSTFLVFYLAFDVGANSWLGITAESNAEVWCKFQPSGYDCKETGLVSRAYYYDLKLGDCKPFNFGTCEHNRNKFKSLADCREQCLEDGGHHLSGNISYTIYCKMQPDFGLCSDYFPSYYFDLSSRSCKGFSYSGCGGNPNRFRTLQQCTAMCNEFMRLPFEQDTRK